VKKTLQLLKEKDCSNYRVTTPDPSQFLNLPLRAFPIGEGGNQFANWLTEGEKGELAPQCLRGPPPAGSSYSQFPIFPYSWLSLWESWRRRA